MYDKKRYVTLNPASAMSLSNGLWQSKGRNTMTKKATTKAPTSIITFGSLLEPETLSSLLGKFGTSYYDYRLIKINDKKAKRDFQIVSGGDIICLYKKDT